MSEQKPRWRWLRRLTIVFVITAVIVGAGWIALLAFYAGQLRDEIEEAGDELSLQVLQDRYYPPIPEVDNAASLWLEAGALYGENETPLEALGYDEAPTDETWRDLRAFLEERKPVFALIEEALQRPQSRFDVDFTDGYAMRDPSVIVMYRLGVLLEASIQLALHDQDVPTAVHQIELLLRKTNHHSLPFLTVRLARASCAQRACDLIADLLALDVSSEQLRRLRDAIPEDDTTFPTLLAVERAMLHALFEQYRRDPSVVYRADNWEWRLRRTHIVDADHAYALWHLREGTAALSLPPQEAATRGQELDDLLQSQTRVFPPKPISGSHLMLLGPVVRRQHRAQAYRAATLAVLEIELILAQTGALPEAIPPGFHDPRTGTPLNYVRGGKGYMVYSVGENGVDDRGDPDDDWVLRVRLPKLEDDF
ncbi:MAG: hypothetical protein AAF581_07435 [Planctomycetota bacterium]